MSRAETLSEAAAMAVRTHPLVASRQAGLAAARHDVDREGAAFYPSLDLSADTGLQRSRRENLDTSDLWRNKQRLSLTQLIYDGQGTANRYGSAQASADAARYDVLSAAILIANRAVHAYLDVSRDRALVERAVENIGLHRSILDDVSEAARSGGGAGARVAQVETRLLNARSQRRRLEGDLENSLADYREAVGQAPGTLAPPPVPAAALSDSFDALVADARENNPDLQAARRLERAAELTAEASESSFLPTIDAELAHERRYNTDASRGLEADTTALLRLTWNLYGGGLDTATRLLSLERRREAQYRTQELDRLLDEDLRKALNDFDVARDRVVLLRERVATAERVREAYGEQFRLGQTTILDLLDSGNEVFVARTDLVSTEYELIRAAYDVLAARGTLLQELAVSVDLGGSAGER